MSQNFKIAVFGGAFNPVHNGHINLCLECDKFFNFDKILLIPTNIPPHKSADNLASNQDRLSMLKLASKTNSLFDVSDIEYHLEGTSYTYKTILELKKIYKNADLYLIVGSDMLKMFHKWYNYKQLLDEVTLVVGAREKSEYEELIKIKENLVNSKKIEIININVITLSSTQIRECIKKNENISHFVNKDVEKYIYSHKLYAD